MHSKKWCHSHKFFYVLFSVTQSLLLLCFSSSRGNIAASNKNSTSKKVPTSFSEITIKYLYKNIIIPPLSQCGLFIQNVSKNLIASEDVIFYLLSYNVISWSFFLILQFFIEVWWIIQGKCLSGPIINLFVFCFFFFAILFYIERKRLLMRNVAPILPLKCKLSGKFQRFNAIIEVSKC